MKAVVFDMDGVLFDTERVCRDSWILVAKEDGLEGMEEVFPQCIGRNSTDTERIVKARYGEDFPYAQFREQTSKVYWDIIESEGHPIKKGVFEVLSFLKENGFKVGLASSTKREMVLAHLKQAGIESHFQVVVGGDQIVHSKPEPDIYLLACRELGTAPQETYAIEDSYNGIRSAARAGMPPIMVPDLLPPTEEMEKLSEVILDDLLGVKAYLQGIMTGSISGQ